MKALPASTSYSFGISSFPNLPRRPRNQQYIIRAKAEPSEKSVEIMRKFSEQYARKSGTYFCDDKSVTAVVIKGLAEHKDTLGAPLCPCRHYDDKAAEAGQGFWNCPCVPMRERYERLPKSMLYWPCGFFHVIPRVTTGLRDFFMSFQGFMKECHCMLFLTPDNDFAGKEQTIGLEEIREVTANM